MKHLSVLVDAGLIQSMSQGRHTRHFHEPKALEPLLPDIPSVQHVIVIGPDQGGVGDRPSYADVVGAAAATPPEIQVDIAKLILKHLAGGGGERSGGGKKGG